MSCHDVHIGTLSFDLNGVATTIAGDSVISRLSKTEDGVTQYVVCVSFFGMAYLHCTL